MFVLRLVRDRAARGSRHRLYDEGVVSRKPL
jgi:hypothetical protein